MLVTNTDAHGRLGGPEYPIRRRSQWDEGPGLQANDSTSGREPPHSYGRWPSSGVCYCWYVPAAAALRPRI
jgi:hypothetical protein